MSRIFFTLMCALLFSSCGSGEAQTTANVNTSTESETTAPQEVKSSEKREACDYLSKEEIARIFGWNAENTTSTLMMSLKDRDVTVCNLVHGDDKLLIRLAWKSEKAAANKVLERRFATFLGKGEENMTYRELQADADGQTIFGSGDGRFGQKIYILRKRLGNTIDIQLELASASAEEKVALAQLQKLLANLNP